MALEPLEGRALLSCNTISGYVYVDANNNGLMDIGESPIANSQLQLYNESNDVVGNAGTDANGFYEFATDSTISTLPQTLTFEEAFPSGYTNWTQTRSIDQFDPALGTLTAVEITNLGSITTTFRFENTDPTPSTVTYQLAGQVSLTGVGIGVGGVGSPLALSISKPAQSASLSAYDGVTDFAGTSGITIDSVTSSSSSSTVLTDPAVIALYTGTGTVAFSETATGASSVSGSGNLTTQRRTTALGQVTVVYHYIPSACLAPANYTIVQSPQPAGYYDGQESKDGVVLPNSGNGPDSISVTLGATDSVNNNFGELLPATIGNLVWNDQDGNGIQDAGEFGMAGATVALFTAGGVQVGASQTTGSGGLYLFTNLLPGEYYVQVTPPAGYLITAPNQGANDALDSDANPADGKMAVTALASGEDDRTWDAGVYLPATIGNLVWQEVDGNGIQDAGEGGVAGATVTLFTGDGVQVGASQTTGAGGAYLFTGLAPGEYYVHVAPPAGYLISPPDQGVNDGKDSDANPLTGNMVITTLSAGEVDLAWDAGVYRPATIGNLVWLDSNANGIQDADEGGVAGATVTLFTGAGVQVGTSQVTGGDGQYLFSGLT
ncbi:MAG TPA: SdrD B-like domain-containing protein, partial [Candidatus Anammoximicrobium sp.]|nr:SdrD B-like domain-containing protein [Candidatus Anammoximicrobium sp.]